VRQQMSWWEGLLVPALLQAKSQEAVALLVLPFCLLVHAKSDKDREYVSRAPLQERACLASRQATPELL